MKVEIFVQYTRERYSNMIKVSQLAPGSVHPLKTQLIDKFRQDWAYFGFANTNADPVSFQWEIGRVSSFWELERDSPPHSNLYDILSKVYPFHLEDFDIAELAMLEDERPVAREYILAYVRKRVAASTPKLTSLFLDLREDDVDTDSTDTDTAIDSTPTPSPVLPLSARSDSFKSPNLLSPETSSKRKRHAAPRPDVLDGCESGLKRLRVYDDARETLHSVDGHSTTGDHPPDVFGHFSQFLETSEPPNRMIAHPFGSGATEEIQRLKMQLEASENESRAAREEVANVKGEFAQWVIAERGRLRASWKECKDRLDRHKDHAAEQCRRAEGLQKEKDDLQAAFEDEREGHYKEVEDLRKRLAEKPVEAPTSPVKQATTPLKSALVDPATQIERYKNYNEQLQRELTEERARSRALPKERDALREALRLAEQNVAQAERARKSAESRLSDELKTIARLRAEQNEWQTASEKGRHGEALALKLQWENLDLSKRLEKVEDNAAEKKILLKQKQEVLRTTGVQLRDELAKSERLQKEVERLQNAQRRRNSSGGDAQHDDWKRRALEAETRCSQLEAGMSCAALESQQESARLAATVSDLETQLAASDNDGALLNIANRQTLDPKDPLGSPPKSKKGKRTTQKELQAAALQEKQHQIARLQQEIDRIRTELDESWSERGVLQLLRAEDAQAIAAEKAARELAERKLEKEVYARAKMDETFKSMSSTSPLLVPAVMQALMSVGELTERVLQ
ncbi:hypothetical protein PHLGIDRAFT_37928 [Phlebiopsis gigantea 11061_1 CR5-6]|uniref:Uncharacterized protein n=1 Tax=Phlebiopsis gigantea (strain 11061_1 CR5-6) TaxID=745531 RepID=A0A0C3PBK9_PHLG1|nr:hypothetical protein PHLGIDRAFT_37928 [Phlebiopsis gigantea 11061_1 CR5-6]